MVRLRLLMWLTLLLWHGAPASDLAREHRIAAQITDGILVGEPVTLTAGELSFLAIHAPANRLPTRGGIILLHGMGANPDWTEVIQPLRSELPEHGWETLSLQMPIAAADAPATDYLALIPEAGPRINAAVGFFARRGVTPVVLIGHSLGARMGLAYLAREARQQISAFVAIGLSASRRQSESSTLQALKHVRIPVLDIYGSRDLDSVLRSAPARARAARSADNAAYRQSEISGADHFFQGLEDSLVSRVNAWLSKAAAATKAERTPRGPAPTK